MALLGSSQLTLVNSIGDAERLVLLSVRNVTTGDTFDLAPYLAKIRGAFFVAMTGLVVGACTAVGTVVTFAPVGLSADGGYLLAVGSAS